MVHRHASGEQYFVQLVSPSGKSGPWVLSKSRRAKTLYYPPTTCVGPIAGGGCAESGPTGYNLPEVSISKTRVYFLDGETVVKSLTPDGTVRTVMSLSAPANSQVVIAVSPDDTRIAVAVITLATSRVRDSFHNVMYVEDLGTGAHRADIYSSTTLAQWPVVWHGRSIVVGVGSTDIDILENPYGATSYRVLDAGTGLQVLSLDCVEGLLGPAGTACATCQGWPYCTNDPSLGKQAWDASKTRFGPSTSAPPKIMIGGADLSPDGKRIAAGSFVDANGTYETWLFTEGSGSPLTPLGTPQGWLGNSHIVVYGSSDMWIVDVDHGAEATKLAQLQFGPTNGMPVFAGVLPTNLG